MGFLRHSGRSLFVFLAICFTHRLGSACAVANVPNPFSWLLWLAIVFYLISSAFVFIHWVLITRLSYNIAIDSKLFK